VLCLKDQLGVDGRRFLEIGAFANPNADADQSITPNCSQKGRNRGSLYASRSAISENGLTSNVYCGVATY